MVALYCVFLSCCNNLYLLSLCVFMPCASLLFLKGFTLFAILSLNLGNPQTGGRPCSFLTV